MPGNAPKCKLKSSRRLGHCLSQPRYEGIRPSFLWLTHSQIFPDVWQSCPWKVDHSQWAVTPESSSGKHACRHTCWKKSLVEDENVATAAILHERGHAGPADGSALAPTGRTPDIGKDETKKNKIRSVPLMPRPTGAPHLHPLQFPSPVNGWCVSLSFGESSI